MSQKVPLCSTHRRLSRLPPALARDAGSDSCALCLSPTSPLTQALSSTEAHLLNDTADPSATLPAFRLAAATADSRRDRILLLCSLGHVRASTAQRAVAHDAPFDKTAFDAIEADLLRRT
jgi:hypothetical protein